MAKRISLDRSLWSRLVCARNGHGPPARPLTSRDQRERFKEILLPKSPEKLSGHAPQALRKHERARSENPLNDQALYDIPRNIRQSEIATRVAEGQPGMVEAQQMENGRVKIVDVYFIFRHLVT